MFDEKLFLSELRQVILVEMMKLIGEHQVDNRVQILTDTYRVIEYSSKDQE